MVSDEGFSSNKASFFDGTNYSLWRLQIQTYLSALGFNIWEAIEFGYIVPSTPPIDVGGKKIYENEYRV